MTEQHPPIQLPHRHDPLSIHVLVQRDGIPGRDVVSADASAKVAADCEIVSRRLSVDFSTNSLSQHETAVEPDDFAWGSTVVAAYQVGRFRTGASSNIGFSVSRNAGRT